MASSFIFLCPKNPQSKQNGGSGSFEKTQNGKQIAKKIRVFVFMLKVLRVIEFQLHQFPIAKYWNTGNGVKS